MSDELNELIDPIVKIAKTAGEKILNLYANPDQLEIQKKTDGTPVTSADFLSHKIIVEALNKLTPEYPIFSEEGEMAPFSQRQTWSRYWLLDPLDGTRGFINRLDDFTVNIALIENHQPILGVLYVPVQKRCYFAYQGGGAFVQEAGVAVEKIHTQRIDEDHIRFIVGYYHNSKRMGRVMRYLPGSELLRVNSSLKLAWISEGQADVYPRFGTISEWDIAAGHCILSEAGGKIVDFNGKSLQYNARESLLCPSFLALGDAAPVDRLIQIFEENAP